MCVPTPRMLAACALTPFIAFLNELGHNAYGNFAWLVGANIEANGTAKGVGLLRRDPGCRELFQQDGPLCFASDDAEKWKVSTLPKDFLEDRPVGGMAHCHAYDEGVVG